CQTPFTHQYRRMRITGQGYAGLQFGAATAEILLNRHDSRLVRMTIRGSRAELPEGPFRTRRYQMSFHRLGFAFLFAVGNLIAPVVAAEPVLLRYKFAKGDQLIYRMSHDEKQVQTVMGQNLESTTRQDVVTLQVVDEIDGDGNAVVKTK